MDVQALRATLEGMPSVELAVLFGSQARGRARVRSDVDLAVRLRDCETHSSIKANVTAAVANSTGKTIDWIELDEAPPLLRFEIARHGLPLVERQVGAWVAFKAKAMVDWWDWAPVARRMWRTYAERLRNEAADGQR